MADMFDKETRSRIMRAVRTAGTEPEERLAVALKALRLRFRRNDPNLFGTPDFAFRQARLAVFVDGCFWHGCPQCYRLPKSRITYWRAKVHGNMKRDAARRASLRRLGWSVIRIWEHQLKANPQNCVERLKQALISRGVEKSKPR